MSKVGLYVNLPSCPTQGYCPFTGFEPWLKPVLVASELLPPITPPFPKAGPAPLPWGGSDLTDAGPMTCPPKVGWGKEGGDCCSDPTVQRAPSSSTGMEEGGYPRTPPSRPPTFGAVTWLALREEVRVPQEHSPEG